MIYLSRLRNVYNTYDCTRTILHIISVWEGGSATLCAHPYVNITWQKSTLQRLCKFVYKRFAFFSSRSPKKINGSRAITTKRGEEVLTSLLTMEGIRAMRLFLPFFLPLLLLPFLFWLCPVCKLPVRQRPIIRFTNVPVWPATIGVAHKHPYIYPVTTLRDTHAHSTLHTHATKTPNEKKKTCRRQL